MLFGDNYDSDDEGTVKRLAKVLGDFFFTTTLGRVVLEAGKMFLMVWIGYMLMCSLGQIIIYAIKFLKIVLEGGLQ